MYYNEYTYEPHIGLVSPLYLLGLGEQNKCWPTETGINHKTALGTDAHR